MKKFYFIILLLAVGCIAGCNLEAGNEGPTVAYSSVGDSNSWFIAFSGELEKEAKKRGYNFRVSHAQSKVEKQIADVEDIVAQSPDYLILGPIDTEGSASALKIAREAGVPVIVVNRDIRGEAGTDYITKIYSDFEWIGEKMGQLVGEAFPEGETIRIVEIHGTPGGGNTIGMQAGLRKVLEENENMELVASQPGNFNRADAMNAMESIINSGKEFDAVICHYDDEALGVIQALKAAGRKVGTDPAKGEIIIVGNGGTNSGLEAIIAGDYYKIVSVTPYYADQVFDAIEAHKKGEALADYIRVDDIVIDADNVDEHIDTGF